MTGEGKHGKGVVKEFCETWFKSLYKWLADLLGAIYSFSSYADQALYIFYMYIKKPAVGC